MAVPILELTVDDEPVDVQFDRLPPRGSQGFLGTLKVVAYNEATDAYTLEGTGEVDFEVNLVTVEFDGDDYVDLPIITILPDPEFAEARISVGILHNLVELD